MKSQFLSFAIDITKINLHRRLISPTPRIRRSSIQRRSSITNLRQKCANQGDVTPAILNKLLIRYTIQNPINYKQESRAALKPSKTVDTPWHTIKGTSPPTPEVQIISFSLFTYHILSTKDSLWSLFSDY